MFNRPVCASVVILFLVGGISFFELISNQPANTTEIIAESAIGISIPVSMDNIALTAPIMGMVSNRTADDDGGVIAPPTIAPAPAPEPEPTLEKPKEKPGPAIIEVEPKNPFNESKIQEHPEKPVNPVKPGVKPVPVPTGTPKPLVVPARQTGINISPHWSNPGWGNISPTWNNPGWQGQANVKSSDINRFNNTVETALHNGKIGKVANHIPIPQVGLSAKNKSQPMKQVGMDSKMNKDNLSRGTQKSVRLGKD
jgi:hypothetical protein